MSLKQQEPFIRYIISAPRAYWWEQNAISILQDKKWQVIQPRDFSFESSYGFDPLVDRSLSGYQIPVEEYCLDNAAIVIEYHGHPVYDSVFAQNHENTLIDDILAYMSIYSGKYCQYYWKEKRSQDGQWSASTQIMMGNELFTEPWASSPENAILHFQKALLTIPSINVTRLRLAMQWYFSALREFEFGRPLVESALNWVCLESQANFLGISGTKYNMVETMLNNNHFPAVPLLKNFYRLRNDGFHEGQLSHLNENDAQLARTAGRLLVRAYLLSLLGMNHSDFQANFVSSYI